MKEFSDIIKTIRDSAHAYEPYSSVTKNVGYAVFGHWYSNTDLFDEICNKLEEAHKKELEDMRRDVADEAEEAKNLMVAQVVSSYNEQMKAIREECEHKVKAAIDKSLDPQRLYGTKPNTFDGVLEALKEFRWQHATNDTDVIPYINRLKAVHDMEIQEVAARYELNHCPSCKAFLDHKERVEHVRKEEYHRGYEDGLKARDVGMWQLDHDRAEVLARLVNSNLESGLVMRSLCFVLGVDWRRYNTTRSLGEMKARLAYLLGGAVEDSKLQKSPDLEDGEDSNMTNSTDCDELEATIAELREKVKNQRERLNTCETIIDEYHEMLTDAATDYRLLKSNNDALKEQVNDLKSKIFANNLRAKIFEMVPKEYHEKKMLSKQMYLDDAIRRADDAAKAAAKLQDDCDMYRTMLNDAAKEYKSLETIVKDIESRRKSRRKLIKRKLIKSIFGDES